MNTTRPSAGRSARSVMASGALTASLTAAVLATACTVSEGAGSGTADSAGGAEGDAAAVESAKFSLRPTKPRVAPIPTENRTAAQVAMLAERPDYNIYKTLAHHPELYAKWSGLGRFVLNGSSLPPRERELVMLRMGWLCQSEYEWAQHARIATETAGVAVEELRRIAEGPAAAGFTDHERALLTMVDELRYEAMISDATWQALLAKYSVQQVMEALFTAAQYQLVSMALNTLGIQLDPGLEHRLPGDLPPPATASRPSTSRLAAARIPALQPEQWNDEQRALLEPLVRDDGSVLALYATLVHHPQIFAPRLVFGTYLRAESGLPPQTRELLILRTAWNIRAEYEWAHHVEYAKEAGLSDEQIARVADGPDAPGWSEEQAALLRAADELRREAFVTDATWAALAPHYDTQRLIEIVFTVGGYTMTGLALNSFGVQVEDGYPGFPRS